MRTFKLRGCGYAEYRDGAAVSQEEILEFKAAGIAEMLLVDLV